MRDAIALTFVICAVAGCAKQAPQQIYAATDPAQIETRSSVFAEATRLGRVTGLSCGRNIADNQTATRAEAEQNVKIEAAKLGATGIARVETTVVRDMITCRGSYGFRTRAVAYR